MDSESKDVVSSGAGRLAVVLTASTLALVATGMSRTLEWAGDTALSAAAAISTAVRDAFVLGGHGPAVVMGVPANLPIAVALGVCALTVIRRLPRNRPFRDVLHLEDLMAFQARRIASLGPVMQAARMDASQPWPSAATPAEWLSCIGEADGHPKADAIDDALGKQLGPIWPLDVSTLTLGARCALAVVMTHAIWERRRASALRNALSETFGHDTVDAEALKRIVSPVLADPKITKAMKDIGERHAYLSTGLAATLEDARRVNGTLSTAEFAWLKGLDRPLYYALNNAGRRSYHVEGLATSVHGAAEIAKGRPLREAATATATAGILAYVDEIGLPEKDRMGVGEKGEP